MSTNTQGFFQICINATLIILIIIIIIIIIIIMTIIIIITAMITIPKLWKFMDLFSGKGSAALPYFWATFGRRGQVTF